MNPAASTPSNRQLLLATGAFTLLSLFSLVCLGVVTRLGLD